MKIKTAFVLACALCAQPVFAQKGPSSVQIAPLSIGQELNFHSDILNEDRTLNIYLPQSYFGDSIKSYPVIFLLDGSMDEDFIHISGLVQFCSFSWINMIPESIVVGIGNVNRQRDFTYPTNVEEDKKLLRTWGSSARFISYLDEEVKPLVLNAFRTDTSSLSLIGQSLGGLLATEILFEKPDMFDNYFIVSPSLWWDNGSLLNATPQPFSRKKSVYIAVGNEGDIMVPKAQALHEKLLQWNNPGLRLFYQYLEDKNHGDALHLAIYDGFEKVFGKKEK